MSAECAAAAKNTGVGNRDVDAPELLMSYPHSLLDGIYSGHIAFQRQTLAVWQRRRNFLRRRHINVRNHHPRAALS